MKIIGVCGSPRKGNSEWMLTTLCRELTQLGADVEILLLRKMDVKMCRGCLACEKGGKERANRRDNEGVFSHKRPCEGMSVERDAYLSTKAGSGGFDAAVKATVEKQIK